MQEPAEREPAQPPPRQPERLADLHGEHRDAARVALGGDVLLRQAHEQRAYAGAEERLLLGDELGRAEVADQRARRDAAAQVQRRGQAERDHAGQLEHVAEVERELGEGNGQLRGERKREPGESGDREQVGRAARELPGAHRAQRDQPEQRQATGEQGVGGASPVAGTAGTTPGKASALAPSASDGEREPGLRDDQRRRRAAGGAATAAR